MIRGSSSDVSLTPGRIVSFGSRLSRSTASEPVYLGPGDDRYDGENVRGPGDVIHGQGGDDVIRGLRGDDILYGGAGDDTLLAGKGHDTLIGGGGDDSLQASEHGNVLIGGAGADAIDLGSRLAGGAGDIVVYRKIEDSLPGDRHDLITAFQTGVDQVDMHRIDADTTTAANDAFSWIGNGAFGGHAGELRFDPSTGLLQGDVTGDGVADFEIRFFNYGDIQARDFFL